MKLKTPFEPIKAYYVFPGLMSYMTHHPENYTGKTSFSELSTTFDFLGKKNQQNMLDKVKSCINIMNVILKEKMKIEKEKDGKER